MKYLIRIISFCLLSITYVACDDMHSVHQQFLDEGEIVYLGKPTIVRVRGGHERVQLEWKMTADPKIEECCIYWNFGQDSATVPPDYTDTIMTHIIPVKEGNYIFEIKNKGKNNLYSLSSTASGKSYGAEYLSYLRNRTLLSQKITGEGTLVMQWATEENCVGFELEYTNNAGIKKQAFLPGNETLLNLSDFTPEGEFKYRTLYLPEEEALDTIPCHYETAHFPSVAQ